MGIITENFQSSGQNAEARNELKICDSGSAIKQAIHEMNEAGRPSGPGQACLFNLRMAHITSVDVTFNAIFGDDGLTLTKLGSTPLSLIKTDEKYFANLLAASQSERKSDLLSSKILI
jgi:hypothetical protein